mgnify:CR=1 FL=1|tara:strand:+ start:4616 stop:4894 length:279 start_codon:yes stop_codon:yes gene_type:complete
MKVSEFLKWALFWCIVSFFIGYFSAGKVYAKNPNVKAKFYDFSEQLIDGEVKRPQALYTDVRQKVHFKRLLRLKRNFLDRGLMQDARLPVFK